ncbi:RNA binding protein, heterogenous nuclear RNP-K like protein [Mortierella sp. NVP85]|nr:RNA binding protein, heterogenous nuclear RNP-K like protein [Mortierella sp. NVP85]
MSFPNTTTTGTTNNNNSITSGAMDIDDNSYYESQQQEHNGREGEGLDMEAPLTLRALVTTKEAGVIIGKAGKNVADLRERTGVKAGVSKVVQGVQERVLTVAGTIDGVAQAFELIAQTLLENPISSSPPSTPVSPLDTSTIRLLISHGLMGTIIGRNGVKIKHIQDISSARMVASKEMLPQSTERIVEVQGDVKAINMAISEIGKCLVEDRDRGVGTVLYTPSAQTRAGGGSGSGSGGGGGGSGFGSSSSSASNTTGRSNYPPRTGNGSDFARAGGASNLRTQEISIPADMVGCIIGKGGTKISEIRRLSGSRISIAKTPHDETGERMFTIVGTTEANERALYLLYGQLEVEKDKRLNMSEGQLEDDEM